MLTRPKFHFPRAAFVVLTCALGALAPAFAQNQDANAPDAALADDAPVVPDAPFPSIIALDEGDTVWTLKVSNGTLSVNGDIAVNSSNRGAIWLADSTITARGGRVSVVGGVSRLGKTSIKPTVGMGGQIVPDPLPQFRIPSPENLVSREKLFLRTEAGGDDTSLPPGIYNGGIFATGDGHITLQPGTFVIANGDFSAIGPTVEGEGVTLVMAGDRPGALAFSLGAQFNASAPTEGKMKDLLVVSRASGNFARGVSFSVAKGQLKGIIYAPNAPVSLTSQSSVQISKIIALSVDVSSSLLDVTGDETGAPPVADAPVADAPVADAPVADAPVAAPPVAAPPVAAPPVAAPPVADAPVADAPVADAPVAQ